jgi:hypothetical protein
MPPAKEKFITVNGQLYKEVRAGPMMYRVKQPRHDAHVKAREKYLKQRAYINKQIALNRLRNKGYIK